MDAALIITTTVTILLAIAGYVFTYLNNLRLSQRKDRLDRVNRQLAELYGPMFSLVNASNIAWQGFRKDHRPNEAYFSSSTTEEDYKEWRLWMSVVFMPINKKLYDLILEKSDLLIETEMDNSLLMFCAHIAAYHAVLEKWNHQDYSEHLSVIAYPKEIEEYARRSYTKLKAEQALLLGKTSK